MKYDLDSPPKYVRQTTTGRIYPFSIFKAQRDDMEPYEMPAGEAEASKEIAEVAQVEESFSAPESGTGDDERREKINAAIAQIPIENYGKPTMGKPALPKVAEVSALAGFKVSAEEILTFVKE